MALILSIETATTNCSIALARDGKVMAKRSVNAGFSHSEKINLFILEVIAEAHCSLNDLQAIAVSIGPGSYTGLRIGVSTAKGLCYALNIPVITVSTLEAMAYGIHALPHEFIVPMIDARRMEAYCAVFDRDKKEISAPEAIVIDDSFYARFREKNHLVLAGDGADKCIDLFANENTIRVVPGFFPAAEFVAIVAEQKFNSSNFDNVALFEPIYLKEFRVGGS
jgi:tRNA threonylcarbamoyladenosine biosynthesis protein TsaB